MTQALAEQGEPLPYGSGFSGSDVAGQALLAITEALATEYNVDVKFELKFVCEKDPAT